MYNSVQYGELTLSDPSRSTKYYFAVSQVELTLSSKQKIKLDLVVFKMTGDTTPDFIDYYQAVSKNSNNKLTIVVVTSTLIFLIFVAYRLKLVAKKITL